MAKKEAIIEEEVLEEETVEETPKTPRIQSDFLREDLNELRDVVNELWEKCA